MTDRTTASFGDLPAELVELVIGHVLGTHDLLSFSMTCTTLYHQIVPDHLNYRSVEFPLMDLPMWQHLLECPRRAENIRVLRVNDKIGTNTKPRNIQRSESNASSAVCDPRAIEAILPSVLKRMKHLRHLVWIRNPITKLAHWVNPDAFWVPLKTYCLELKSVDCRCRFECGNCRPRPEFKYAPSKLFDLDGLASYTQVLECIDNIPHRYDSVPMTRMLTSSPPLERLRLCAARPRCYIDGVPLLNCRFPALKHLDLEKVHFGSDEEAFISFLASHPQIMTLRIHDEIARFGAIDAYYLTYAK
ncbi:hypothetical protein FRB99_007609 [Tulasnella sp. 403]|nr:hypothetical protein FRB99_007609 [Tulasnella sp. 403]